MRWLTEVPTTILSKFRTKIHANPSDTRVNFIRICSYTCYADVFIVYFLVQQLLSRSGPQVASVSILPIRGNYGKISI